MIKELSLQGFSGYYISNDGKVFNQKRNGELRELKMYKGNYDFIKVNLYGDNKKQTTKLVHVLVYESFKGKNYSNIVFLDGNKSNCSIDNLVSMEELRNFYNTNIKRINLKTREK